MKQSLVNTDLVAHCLLQFLKDLGQQEGVEVAGALVWEARSFSFQYILRKFPESLPSPLSSRYSHLTSRFLQAWPPGHHWIQERLRTPCSQSVCPPRAGQCLRRAPFYSRTAPGTGIPPRSWLQTRDHATAEPAAPCGLRGRFYPGRIQNAREGSGHASSRGQRVDLHRLRRRGGWPSGRPSVLHEGCGSSQGSPPLRPRSRHWLPLQRLVNTRTPGWRPRRGPTLSEALVTPPICRPTWPWHAACELHLAKGKRDLWVGGPRATCVTLDSDCHATSA